MNQEQFAAVMRKYGIKAHGQTRITMWESGKAKPTRLSAERLEEIVAKETGQRGGAPSLDARYYALNVIEGFVDDARFVSAVGERLMERAERARRVLSMGMPEATPAGAALSETEKQGAGSAGRTARGAKKGASSQRKGKPPQERREGGGGR